MNPEDTEENAASGSYLGAYRTPRPGEYEEVRADLEKIVQALEAILARRSRWPGTLVLEQSALHSGTVDPDGNITIVTGILDEPPNRWRTLIHEALHTFSPRFERSEYRSGPGWEEGVVEQLQRFLRQRILGIINVAVPEQAFAPVDETHLYNRYLRALETVRADLGEEAEPFYEILLATHLTQRFAVLQMAVNALPEGLRGTAKTRLLLAHKTLTGSASIL